MKFSKSRSRRMLNLLLVVVACFGFAARPAHGELHWRKEKKQPMKVRLVAVLQNYPRSSFFSSEEVFLAEQQFTPDESRLIKLVYGFLPYQPPLSDTGLDYSVVHEIIAVRSTSCDETLSKVEATNNSDRQIRLQYSAGSPGLQEDRHHNALPCYLTNANEYEKAIHDPAPLRAHD